MLRAVSYTSSGLPGPFILSSHPGLSICILLLTLVELCFRWLGGHLQKRASLRARGTHMYMYLFRGRRIHFWSLFVIKRVILIPELGLYAHLFYDRQQQRKQIN